MNSRYNEPEVSYYYRATTVVYCVYMSVGLRIKMSKLLWGLLAQNRKWLE